MATERTRSSDGSTRFTIARGLDVPVAGEPEQIVGEAPPCTSVGLVTNDYRGLSASVSVREGERVRPGQTLYEDRKNPGVRFTSPVAGVVTAIHRGARRALQSIVVALDGDDAEPFTIASTGDLARLDREHVTTTLLTSGLWTALRTRPYGKIPRPGSLPSAIFVNAADSNPLAPDPRVVIASDPEAFADGVQVVSRLTNGEVFVCCRPDAVSLECERARVVTFVGPHPAGLVGTHIHFLKPVGATRTVWHLGCQDVMAIGRLFRSGYLVADRIVALAGPVVRRPRLVRVPLGANVEDLVREQLHDGACRVVSGSVLSGRAARPPASFLGRYHDQVSVLRDETEGSEYSFHRRLWPLAHARRGRVGTTASSGRPWAHAAKHAQSIAQMMVPLDSFDRMMPLDILATPLLRALLVGDLEAARALGCLELEEEDLALCSFVCPAKNDYGALLRFALDEIERRA